MKSREIIAKRQFLNPFKPSLENSAKFLCLEFFKMLDLDGRVEFLRIKGSEF